MLLPAFALFGFGATGAIVGSFISTVVERINRGEQWAAGRSHCDQCVTEIPYSKSLPIFSFITLKGRCNSCGSPIALLHLASEIAGAILFLASAALFPTFDSLAFCALSTLLLTASLIDIKQFRIPNGLTLAVLGVSLTIAVLKARLIPSVIAGGLASSTLLLVALLFRRIKGRAGIGYGDIKLFGALSVALGPERIAIALTFSAFGALAFTASRQSNQPADRIPFGPFLASGALLALVLPSDIG